ncbi:hypothetical protein SAY87_000837 [Trapa incisa]|uniref:FAD/NAD(P)-binding domain-containing protein n=1 Tax=Trapa incisa TaxID=236973 RepID=A0AAN7JA30_9MYRT|nr:hypothetical protein SAY87_000837 [Trapa incisa]
MASKPIPPATMTLTSSLSAPEASASVPLGSPPILAPQLLSASSRSLPYLPRPMAAVSKVAIWYIHVPIPLHQICLRGIEFHTEESPQAIHMLPDGSLSLKITKGTVDGFSHVMFATGRQPNTKNLGLDSVGVKMSKNGAIKVDEFSQTPVHLGSWRCH